MRAISSVPWIEHDLKNNDFKFETVNTVSSSTPIAASCHINFELLLNAYKNGVFPWSGPCQPILWWRPNPRMVLTVNDIKISSSLKKSIKQELKKGMRITMNKCFKEVLLACAAPRQNNEGTWITSDIIRVYQELNKRNFAHSVEIWQNDELVGGLYFVSVGAMVYGESMFFRKPNASKIALAALSKWLKIHGGKIIDCQQETKHLASLGARAISNDNFIEQLRVLTSKDSLPWKANPLSEKTFK